MIATTSAMARCSSFRFSMGHLRAEVRVAGQDCHQHQEQDTSIDGVLFPPGHDARREDDDGVATFSAAYASGLGIAIVANARVGVGIHGPNSECERWL